MACNKPSDISKGLSDFTKSYIPDFGYQTQLDFDIHKNGWHFLLDFISKYPKREKTFNLVRMMNKLKKAKVKQCCLS